MIILTSIFIYMIIALLIYVYDSYIGLGLNPNGPAPGVIYFFWPICMPFVLFASLVDHLEGVKLNRITKEIENRDRLRKKAAQEKKLRIEAEIEEAAIIKQLEKEFKGIRK